MTKKNVLKTDVVWRMSQLRKTENLQKGVINQSRRLNAHLKAATVCEQRFFKSCPFVQTTSVRNGLDTRRLNKLMISIDKCTLYMKSTRLKRQKQDFLAVFQT